MEGSFNWCYTGIAMWLKVCLKMSLVSSCPLHTYPWIAALKPFLFMNCDGYSIVFSKNKTKGIQAELLKPNFVLKRVATLIYLYGSSCFISFL